ncbi:MAG: hypothetical protein ACT4N9_07245 [Paracoccaceae bacterium]
MDHQPFCLEDLEPATGAAQPPRSGMLSGLAALMILVAVGLVAVLPARALVFPGPVWAEMTGGVGGQADSLDAEPCNVGAALALGLRPVCAMTLP